MDEKIKELKYDLIEVDHSLHGRILPFEKDFRDMEAEGLYKKGYRKIPENAVVLETSVYESMEIKNYRDVISERVRKETAEKFAERLKEYVIDDFSEYDYGYLCMRIDEICKKITEGDV